MKKAMSGLLMLCLIFWLGSCQKEELSGFDTGEAFTIYGVYTDKDRRIAGCFTHTEAKDTLLFSAPEDMAGITATAERGEGGITYTLTYENMTVEVGEKAKSLFRPFELLCPQEVLGVEKRGDMLLLRTKQGRICLTLDRDKTPQSACLLNWQGEQVCRFDKTQGEVLP